MYVVYIYFIYNNSNNNNHNTKKHVDTTSLETLRLSFFVFTVAFLFFIYSKT